MRTIIKSLLILSLFAIWSCEQVIEVPIPDHTSEIVMSCFYTAGDDTIQVVMTNSIGVLKPDTLIQPIENATINFFEDGNLLFAIPESNVAGVYEMELTSPLKFGAEYRLEAAANGYESVSAVQTMQDTVPIIDVLYEPDAGTSPYGYIQDRYTIEFQDKAGEENYYQVMVRQVSNDSLYPGDYPIWTESLDPILKKDIKLHSLKMRVLTEKLINYC